MLAKKVATCIPTVSVVKIVDDNPKYAGFWTVERVLKSRVAGEHHIVNVGMWTVRESTVLVTEMLQKYGCETNWFKDF
jgi:hypothetical protein